MPRTARDGPLPSQYPTRPAAEAVIENHRPLDAGIAGPLSGRTDCDPVAHAAVPPGTAGLRVGRAARRAGRVLVVVLLGAWFVFAAVVLAMRYAVLPNVDRYRHDVERAAGRALGEVVTIGAIDAAWHGLRPSLALRDVRVVDATGRQTLALPSVRATLSWDSLAAMELRLASLDLDGPVLAIRRDAAGQLFVGGVAIHRKTKPDNRPAEWLLAQNAIRIHGGRVAWRDEMAPPASDGAPATAAPPDLVFDGVDFALVRAGRRHRMALRATPPAEIGAPLDVRMVVDHPLLSRRADPATWRGELYADVATADVARWRAWLPLPATLDSGRGRARAWLQFERADAPAGSFARRLAERTGRPLPPMLDRIAGLTADLALDDVGVHWGTVGHAALASVDGRIVATQTAREQRFAAHHMALQPLDGTRVPPTDFALERTLGANPADESGHATLGAIDIGVSLGLVPQALVPPAIAEKLAALKPRGALDRLSFGWTGPVVSPATFDIDAAFHRLALEAQAPTAEAVRIASHDVVGPDGVARRPHPPFGQPGFTDLDGTLVARRTATAGDGPTTTIALKVHGAGTTVTAPGLFDEPVLRLANVAADVGVTAHGRDVEVTVANGTLDNADLAGNVALTFRHGPASGGVGEDGGRGWIDLDARLTRADVARVPGYLPNLIGPRVRGYLSKSLLAGRVSDARFRMHGPLQRLDLRAMPGAAAVANPVPVSAALAAVRDAPGHGAAPAIATAFAPMRTPTGPDDALFRVTVKVDRTRFLYGPARDPADEANGAVAGAAAVPSIAWPAFEDVDADIVIDQSRLVVAARSARVDGYRLTDVVADLPALADPAHVLRVTGHGNGPLQDLLRFVAASPVSRWLGHATDAAQARGDAALALALDLPLTHPRDTELAASLHFADDAIAMSPLVPPFERVAGRVDFTDRSVTIDGLTGRALGGPFRVDAKTGDDGWIEVGVGGAVDVAALRASVHDGDAGGTATAMASTVDRVTSHLNGGARYTATMRLLNKRAAALAGRDPVPLASGRPDLLVESDLVGLGIDLPAPLTKAAADAWPLRIALVRTPASGDTATNVATKVLTNQPVSPARDDLRIAIGDRVAADVARQATPDGRMAVTSAQYRIGDGVDAARPATGGPSSVRIALPRLDVDAWRDALRQASGAARAPVPAADAAAAAASAADRLLPERAHLETPLLHVGGRDFTGVTIDAQRLASGWSGDVTADQVAGRLSYTDVSGTTTTRNGVAAASNGRLVARLTHLSIPKPDPAAAPAAQAPGSGGQKDFPAIDLVADRFELRGRALGRLEVVAVNVANGDDHEWQLEKLGLTMPEAHFSANGAWGRSGADENTRLAFDIAASDVGALMDRFGLTRTIKNGTARLTGNAAWQGGPTTIDFGTMEGRMRLEADKGQFLKADPGIAKLLNILSLQGLARRLTFDFNDVFAEGFAFDTVRADAAVAHGIASTDDFTMRGVQATVSMSGTADLARETTDLHVLVKPEINAGAASLGVAVVNPVLGLATFAAQYLFKDRISNALSFEYNVVGPWARPDVTKIDHQGKVTAVPKKAPAVPAPPPAPAN